MRRGILQKKIAADPDNPTTNEWKDAKIIVKNGMLASWFLRGANNELYGDLKIELENDYAKGLDNYPASVDEAVALLNAYLQKKYGERKPHPQYDTGVAFAQKEESELKVGRSRKREKKQVLCHRCKQRGHYAHECKNDLLEEANAHEEMRASSEDRR